MQNNKMDRELKRKKRREAGFPMLNRQLNGSRMGFDAPFAHPSQTVCGQIDRLPSA
jgi:hypothetical protein